MGSAIAANEIQTERIRKRRRDDFVLEKPTSTPLPIGDHKSVKKSPVKKENVLKKATVKLKPVKGPGPHVQKPIEEKVMTREERIVEMENQKVLNGRVFDPEILTEITRAPYLHKPEVREFYYKMELLSDGVRINVKEVKIFLDKETLGIILGVPVKGIRSIEGCKPSSEFTKHATKRGYIKRAGLPNKFLRGEYQLMFEFINKEINLPTIMLEHMHRVMTWKSAKHSIPYGYLLNHVFKHFEVPLRRVVPVLLNDKEVEIAQLKAHLQKAISKGPGTNSVDEKEVKKLRADNEQLLKTNASLSEEVQALNKQIIQTHVDANERITLLMRSLTPPPS
ncbi:hypothetical protein KY290_005013 [Solanum tuberosum]|uniref:Uncharacterized protein n=1 Tax=Solanum tuberosum TaxID=4113 RepID=A0ABQ7WCV6_SOLTU|nr:hypothetical protein KY289_005377 [Solanum tuberosum]KAH0778586.1 hypothetical protein KY290_005013 [Solanum tuberosum]